MKLKKLKENPVDLKRPEGISNAQWVKAVQLYEAAKNVGDKFPELTVAQAALETGWFKKESGKNNFFGQKAASDQKGSDVSTHEFINGQLVPIKDRFRDYDSIENSLLDRKQKWMSKYNNANTPREAISKIWRYDENKKRGVGYATDPEYGNKINKILTMLGVKEGASDSEKPLGVTLPYMETKPTVATDNTAVKQPKIPSLATAPINPTYAELPEEQKQEVQQERAISEEQVRNLLAQERQAVEERFLNAFQQQNANEEVDYVPQSQQEDLSYLYNYIDVENYADGGKKDGCECGCPGKPPCPDLEVESKDDPRYKAYVDSLQLYEKSHRLRDVLNNLKGNSFKGSKKYWVKAYEDLSNTLKRVQKDHGSLDAFEPDSYFTGVKAIQGDNTPFPTNHPNFHRSGKIGNISNSDTNDAIFSLYGEPKQKVVVKPKIQPRKKAEQVNSIESKGIEISQDAMTSTNLPKLKIPEPRYWEVEIQVNSSFGAYKTKKYVHSLEELEKLKRKQTADEKSKTGKNNKLIITPKYK